MSIAPRTRKVRKDWGRDDSESPILHVDMDSFFAAVEQVSDPQLRNRPLIVGGTRSRGVVTSCTYDVRARGVRAGMPMAQATALAPEAVVVKGQHAKYREYSGKVMEILSRFTPLLEAASIDEAYLDVSGARRQFGTPLQIAEQIRSIIRQELALPASVGIARNKTVAKIASAYAKPDGLLLIPGGHTEEFLSLLPVAALPGVGKRTRESLERWGIDTVGQIAATEERELTKVVGAAAALSLRDRARGIDRRRVGEGEGEKSISTEETFASNLISRSEINAYLTQASHQCAQRLRAGGLRAWTVHLKWRDAGFVTRTRSVTLTSPTDVGREIASSAVGLFAREVVPSGGVRLAGVGTSGLVLVNEGVPVPMDDDGRLRDVEAAMDSVVQRFGAGAITPASVLGKPWEFTS